jgi:hypothetical protein
MAMRTQVSGGIKDVVVQPVKGSHVEWVIGFNDFGRASLHDRTAIKRRHPPVELAALIPAACKENLLAIRRPDGSTRTIEIHRDTAG